MLQTLKKFLPARPFISGDENGIAAIIRETMEPLCDSVKTDATGNLICFKKGSAPAPRRVMLTAHMDEIGFLVTYIEENGYLRVAPIGGINATAAAYSEVVFAGGLRGVFVPAADASAKSRPKTEDCVVDIGADSRRAAERKVAVGDALALPAHCTKLAGKRVAGRPLDNRAGCAVLAEVAAKLTAPADDIYYVFTVQEEVGCRGAAPAAFEITPDVALNFDVTATGDEQGAKPMAVALGKGVAVKIKDGSVICHRGLTEELLTLAEEKNIPAQCEILLYGGTDTGAVQMSRGGCRAGALSIPCRYIHSGVETIDLGDAEAAVNLAVAFLGGEKQ